MKRVLHGSVGSTTARCKADPCSNPESAPQGGFCHWAFQRWGNGEEPWRKDVRMCECIVCMKEMLIKLKRVASGHQTYKKSKWKEILKMEQNLRLIPAADIGACCVDHAHESIDEVPDQLTRSPAPGGPTLLRTLHTLVHSSQRIPNYIK